MQTVTKDFLNHLLLTLGIKGSHARANLKTGILSLSVLGICSVAQIMPADAAALRAVALSTNTENTTLPQTLSGRLSPYIGQEISAELLEDVLKEVNRYYKKDLGLPFSEAYLPEQTITDGVVNVYVHDPVVGSVMVANQSYLNDSTYKMLFSPLEEASGKGVSAQEFESNLLKLADLGVLDLKGTFLGNSLDPDVEVAVADKDLIFFDVFADNHGTKAAGQYRFGAQGKLRNLSGNADTLSLFYARSSKSQNNYALSYEIPISSSPTVLGAVLCFSDYELAREYEVLDAKGEYQSYELYLRHPVSRSANDRVDFTAGVRYRDLTDEFAAFDVRFKKKSYAAYGGLSGAWRLDHDVYAAAYSTFTVGRLDVTEDDFDIYEDGGYALLNFGGLIELPIVKPLSFFLRLDGQLSPDDVDSSEHLVVSGASGVSAYDSSAAQGDQGLLVSTGLEFKPLSELNFTIKPHLDYGFVRQNDLHETEHISGIGLAFKVEYSGFYANVDFSHTLGHEPDNSRDNGKVFFSVGWNFN